MTQPRHIRIFLSSPGDVADERSLALQIFERLQYDPLLRGQVTIEAVAWDKPGADTPLLATMTPQEAINEGLPVPSECDLVVVIFWARMGTPLPEEYKKPDGTRYLSGTEWEYEDAVRASRISGRPLVVVYRRMQDIAFNPRDAQFGQKLEQWQRVEAFFTAFMNPDGSIRQGFNTYITPDEFASKFETHLKELVKRLLDEAEQTVKPLQPAPAPSEPLPLWEGSPFPGLRAFTPADAPIFFGRGTEADSLVKRLSSPSARLITVVGASGSGKSSLVGAGLLPRLAGNAIEGSKDWLLPECSTESTQWSGLRFTPGEVGNNPFMALALKLVPLINRSPREVAAELEADPGCLGILIETSLTGRPRWAEVLVFLDQFEELFTLVNPKLITPFVRLLSVMVTTPRIRLVLTLRADFYATCVEYPELAALLEEATYPLASPGMGALYEMIVRPAERAGLVFEAGLPDRVLHDTGIDPGALALMAYALDELYHTSDDQLLTHSEYDALGGVQGAIGKRAENMFLRLDAEAQASLPNVFREICEVNERGVAIRRRASLKQVARTEAARRLVDALTNARLLVQSATIPLPGERATEPVVEVAHEALLRSWARLAAWIEDTQDELRLLRFVRLSAEEWARGGRRDVDLLTGSRLERVRALPPDVLTASEQDYVQASTSVAEGQQREEARRRRNLNQARFGLVLAVALVAILGVFFLSEQNRIQAEANTGLIAERNQSDSLRLASEANSILQTNGNAEIAALLSINALKTAYTQQADTTLAQAVDRLFTHRYFAPEGILKGNWAATLNAVFSPDGRQVLIGTYHQGVHLLDAATGDIVRIFDDPGYIRQGAFSPDGKRVLTSSWWGDVRVWETATGNLLQTFPDVDQPAEFLPDSKRILIQTRDGQTQIWDIQTSELLQAFSNMAWGRASPDGIQVLTQGSDPDGKIMLWDADTGELLQTLDYSETVWRVLFSPDGKYILFFDSAGQAALCESATGNYPLEIRDAVRGVFLPGSKQLLIGTTDGRLQVWDISSGLIVREWSGHGNQISVLAESPDGLQAVSGSMDSTLRLWDVETGRLLREFSGHTDTVWSAAFSPDGRQLVTVDEDMTARLWNLLEKPQRQFARYSPAAAITSLAVSPDGLTLSTGNNYGQINLWDIHSSTFTDSPPGLATAITSLAFSPDGLWLAIGGSYGDGAVHLWNINTGEAGTRFLYDQREKAEFLDLTFSKDSKQILAGTYDAALLWDVASGNLVKQFTGENSNIVMSVAFSPDDRSVVTGSYDGKVRIWDVETAQMTRLLSGHNGVVYSVAVSPDGRLIASGSGDNRIILWDMETGKPVRTLNGHNLNVNSVAFSPDGTMLVSGSADSTARIWNVATGETLRVIAGPIHDVRAVAWLPNGQSVFTGSSDGTVRLWDVDYHRFIAYACTRIFRDLTDAERGQFTVPNTASCPAFGDVAKRLLENGS